MDFQASKTRMNLARAFAGECQDGAFYQFIAKDCQQDYKYLSDLVKGIAKNEMAHAGMFYQMLLKLAKNQPTKVAITADYSFAPYVYPDSLASALKVERDEALKIYPEFAQIARQEGFPAAAELFDSVSHDEQYHVNLLTQICQKIDKKQLYQSATNTDWICSNCAHHECSKAAWQKCPSCGFPQGFVEITLLKSWPAVKAKQRRKAEKV